MLGIGENVDKSIKPVQQAFSYRDDRHLLDILTKRSRIVVGLMLQKVKFLR